MGLSSTIDVLLQQQTLESEQLALTSARHDAYVAGAALLAAMGRLQVEDLVSGVAVYEPARSFDRVKAKGSTPWEPLIAAIDRVGEPSETPDRSVPLPQARATGEEVMLPAAAQPNDVSPQSGPIGTP